MKTIFKFLAISIISIIVIYSAIWFGAAIYTSKYITENYGDRETKIPEMGNNYSIFFRSANVSGYPFAFGVQLAKFRETTNDGVVEYKAPIEFGYNLRTLSFYRKFNGSAIARLRPIHSQMGSIVDGYSYLSIKYPLTSEVLEKITNLQERQAKGEFLLQEDYLPLLRGLKKIEFIAENVVAKDITSKEVIYQSPASYMRINFAYNNQDKNFILPTLKYLPSEYNARFKMDIASATEGKQILVNNLMFGLMLPATTKITGDFDASIDLSSVEDFDELNQPSIWGKILTKLDVNKLNARNDAVEFDFNINYNADTANDIRNMSLKTALIPRKNFKNDILAILTYAPDTAAVDKAKKQEWIELINKYYTKNPDKISFDISLSNKSLNIEKLAIDLEDMGAMLQVYTDWDGNVLRDLSSPYAYFQSNGKLSLFNFNKLVDNTVEIAFDTIPELKNQQIFMFKQRVPLTEEPFKESVKKFARLISAHPESSALDVIIEYKYDAESGLQIKSKNLEELNAEYLKILMQEILSSKNSMNMLKDKLRDSKMGGILDKLKNIE